MIKNILAVLVLSLTVAACDSGSNEQSREDEHASSVRLDARSYCFVGDQSIGHAANQSRGQSEGRQWIVFRRHRCER